MTSTKIRVCKNCGKAYKTTRPKKGQTGLCSRTCLGEWNTRKGTIKTLCSFCSINVDRQISQKNRSKSGNIFCSKSCAAKYNNTHKTSGTKRSKLEIWLENQLVILYPSLEFKFNSKEAINSELDIYLPKLRLAFELNGIFHYEPIFGENKLLQIQNNDTNKFQLCQEKGISLCIIDVSKLTYFKPENAKEYLEIISTIIDKNL